MRCLLFFANISILALFMSSCSHKVMPGVNAKQSGFLTCLKPKTLSPGDKVALLSPAYYTDMENVYKTAELLQTWGLEPVIGPNVGKTYAEKYAGTVEQRLSDIKWALDNPDIKAIICNRGGYGVIHLTDIVAQSEFTKNPKWVVGYSDITNLHSMLQVAGVMSLHATMSSSLAKGGNDLTSTLMRDLIMGKVPEYTIPAHPQNICGKATGVLVGGNLMTFAPLVGSNADVTAFDDIILFIEEVGESMHNIDRQINMLRLTGALNRCKGIILGEFTDCGHELGYENVEEMIRQYLVQYNIPVACGFPAGHDDINLPLVLGAPVTLDVTPEATRLLFNIQGEKIPVIYK